MTQRRTLYNDKRVNSPEDINKHLYTKHWSFKLCEAKLIELKRETDNSTIIVGIFNITLAIMRTTTRQKIDQNQEENISQIHCF